MRDKSQGRDLRMGGQNQIVMWNRETDDATLPELSPAGTSKSQMPAANQWHCMEFQMDGASGRLTTWMNGALVPGLVADGVPTPDVDGQWARQSSWRPVPEDFRIGWESYGGDARTLWFDDVAMGSQRIGCGF
jgi:hypothetical protein